MTSKTFLLVALCLGMMAPSVNSFWRLPCAKPLTVQRLDPIVNPGTVSGHIHTIMGGSAFYSRVTTDELTNNSTCATCTVLEDNSNYWVATLWYQHANGTLEAVKQGGGALVYYLQRYNSDTDKKLYAFPAGLRMLAGSPAKRAYDGTLEGDAASYACLDYDNPTAETHAFPQKNCPEGLRTQIFFPSCWDGVNLDSADHKSHMAYPSQMNNGVCPSTHPVRLISLFYEVTWDVNAFKDGWIDANGKPYRAQPFIWSFGDNTGFGMHGDFLNGWDVDVLQKAVDDCTDLSGVIEYCQHFTFRSSDDANACLPMYQPESNDTVSGQLQQLPNISPIPVATFDPCGYSPAQGYDNTVAGQPLGTCNGTFTNQTAYTFVNGVQGKDTPVTPETPTPLPPVIDPLGYLGCYVDGTPSRTMEKQLSGSSYTPATCRAAVQALNKGYVVFGVQYGGECWTSTNSTRYASEGVSTGCTIRCRADPNGWTNCGGSLANQVYTVNV